MRKNLIFRNEGKLFTYTPDSLRDVSEIACDARSRPRNDISVDSVASLIASTEVHR